MEDFDAAPHSIEAEQGVLGAMMLSQDALAEALELVTADDFYRPAHATIFQTATNLYGRGEAVDAVTISGELVRAGEINRVGGAPYLHQLISSVPTATNVAHYADIVLERAKLRRLQQANRQIAQIADGGNGLTADEILDQAQALIFGVAEKRGGEDYVRIGEVMPGALDEIEAAAGKSANGEQMTGCPTGFIDLDDLTQGLHPGQMITVAGRPGMGKALALDTPLPTPGGWTTMGQVQVGDELIGADGKPTRVIAATEVMHGRPCYEVEFSDGSVIVADARHQWVTETRSARRGFATATASTVTTEEIAATLRCRTADRRLNHSIALAAPAQFPEAVLPVQPYTLGAWLGDGHSSSSRFTTDDPEILEFIEADGYRVTKGAGDRLYGIKLPEPPPKQERACVVCGTRFLPATSNVRACGKVCGCRSRGIPAPPPTCPDCGGPSSGLNQCRKCRYDHGTFQAMLRKAGVLDDKHIPFSYLRASEHQRRELLAGLLDTDGYVSPGGVVQLAITNERLAHGALELVLSLGYRATMRQKRVRGRSADTSTCYQINFTPPDKVFKLPRKVARQSTAKHVGRRFVSAVHPIASVPVRCVQVDNADHLYLAGRSWIPTHNSTLGMDFARAASIKNGLTSAFFSLEMSRNEIAMRLLSAEARVGLHHLRSGSVSDEDWSRMASRLPAITDAPLFIDDSANMTMMEIRAKARRLRQRHDLRLIIVDYLQLMSSGKRIESRQVEVSEFSRQLKLLAKELQVPVVALSQLNRGPEQRVDKVPMISDLRESGSIEQDSDVVILVHRPDAYDKESPRAGEADLIVAKHRNGPTATVTVAFQGHYSRFVDMAC